MTCKSAADLEQVLAKLRNIAKILVPDKVVTISGGWNKTVTYNKSDIQLCVCDENGNVHDFNTLVWVTVHELAHVKCKSIGHTREWSRIHEELVQRAVDLKLYSPSQPLAKWYCGVQH